MLPNTAQPFLVNDGTGRRVVSLFESRSSTCNVDGPFLFASPSTFHDVDIYWHALRLIRDILESTSAIRLVARQCQQLV